MRSPISWVPDQLRQNRDGRSFIIEIFREFMYKIQIRKGCTIKQCPGCKREFYCDKDHKQCNDCEQGIQIECGLCAMKHNIRFHACNN